MSWEDTIVSTKPSADAAQPQADDSAPAAAPVDKPASWEDTIQSTPPAKPAASKQSMPSTAEALMRGAAQGGSAGFADEATAGLGAVKDYIAGKFGLRGDIDLPDAYKGWKQAIQARDQAAQQAHPTVFDVGEMGGNAMLAAAPGLGALNAGKGAALGEVVAKSALQGGLTGYGKSNADSLTGDAGNAALGVGLGALGGLGGYGAGKALGAVGGAASDALAPVADWLDKKANARAIKALAPTLSQQELLNNKGVADELGQQLRDQGVVKFGSSVKDMAPRLEEFLGKKGQRIGDIRDEVSDAMGNSVDLSRLRDKGNALSAFTDASDTATQKMADAYGQNASALARVPERSVNEAQEIVQGLNNQIPFNKPYADLTPEQQALKQLRGDIVGQVDQNVNQYSPELGKEYQDLKNQFGLFKNAEPILDKAAARQDRNADFGLRDMLAATAAGAQGNAGGVKQAAAALASKLARERGNSAAATGLGWMADQLQTNPERLGKFAGVLQGAAARGLPALMATHQALLNDPDYQKVISSTDDQHFADGGDVKAASDDFAKTYGTNPDANPEPGIQEDDVLPHWEHPGDLMGAAPVPPEFAEAEDGTPVLNYGNAPQKTITQATTGFKPSSGVRVLPDSSNLTTDQIANLLKKLGGAR